MHPEKIRNSRSIPSQLPTNGFNAYALAQQQAAPSPFYQPAYDKVNMLSSSARLAPQPNLPSVYQTQMQQPESASIQQLRFGPANNQYQPFQQMPMMRNFFC